MPLCHWIPIWNCWWPKQSGRTSQDLICFDSISGTFGMAPSFLKIGLFEDIALCWSQSIGEKEEKNSRQKCSLPFFSRCFNLVPPRGRMQWFVFRAEPITWIVINIFVDLKSNSALLYNKGHNFWKAFHPEKFPKTEYFPTKRII